MTERQTNLVGKLLLDYISKLNREIKFQESLTTDQLAQDLALRLRAELVTAGEAYAALGI